MATARASQKMRVPQIPGQTPLVNKVFREFEGINTQSARQAIAPGQFSWIENVMPIGFGNAKVVAAPSSALATLVATTYYCKSFNISNTPYMFYACSNGAAYQVLMASPWTITQVAPAATFPSSGTQIAQWKNERILIINQNNYYSWNGAALTILGGTTSAPTAGQCIATYAGRVWISQGRTINYSGAGSYTDFGGSGGNTIITDETLTSDITQLLSANNFLYFFGTDSVNVISDVQVVGGVTQFSNTNISANSGTDLAQSIFAYYRAIWYMNQDGIFGLYGATPKKASDELDGIFQNIDFTKPVTGGTVSIYNILCAAFLFTYADPVLGMSRPLMAVYFNKKWFVVSQNDDDLLMASVHGTGTAGVDRLFLTNGTAISQAFSDTAAEIDSTLSTAFWDMGDFISVKEALKLGIEANLTPGVGSISPTVDTEYGETAPESTFSAQFEFTWTNNVGDLFTWTNSLAQTFTWLASGYVWFSGGVETVGHYLGVTSASSTPQVQYSGIQLQYRALPTGWGGEP